MKGQPMGEMAFKGAGRHKCPRVDLFYQMLPSNRLPAEIGSSTAIEVFLFFLFEVQYMVGYGSLGKGAI